MLNILFVVLLLLKLAHIINCSWWIIFIPAIVNLLVDFWCIFNMRRLWRQMDENDKNFIRKDASLSKYLIFMPE